MPSVATIANANSFQCTARTDIRRRVAVPARFRRRRAELGATNGGMWTRDLATADASCGGKAHGLAKLIAAGLRVPAGFVIDHRAFRVATGDVVGNTADPSQAVIEPDPGISLRLKPETIGHTLGELARKVETVELPKDLVEEVTQRARELGGPFAVRSSATIEDSSAGSAAGVFSSRTAVSLDDLWPAIRAVWISALTPLAATYARRRGGEIAIAVIVQRYIDGELVTFYTRPPGEPESTDMLQQQRTQVLRYARDPASQLVTVERVLDAPRGVDIEQIVTATPNDWNWAGAWFVQARPIIHPVIKPRMPPPPVVLVPLQDGRVWKLDVTHNPDPLSIAQTDLVHRACAAGTVPWEARVIAGYLYTTPRDVPPIEKTAALWPSYTQIAIKLAECLDPPPASLEEAIERYVDFLRHWAELSATIAAHRPAEPVATHRPSSLEVMLLQAARLGKAESDIASTIGVFAPSWDVATPTFAERPGLLRDALARAHHALPHATPPEVDLDDRAATLNQLVADLAELDDHWFAQAQWMIRKAILDRADALGIAREDAFWIPIDVLITGLDPGDARRRASGAQAAATRASSWNMPIVVGDRESLTRDPGVALRGIGSGHQITGRVRRFESLASAIVVGHGDIVVTRAVTPALAVIVIGCAAIISETGRLLDHGAAMARELGIPCVVGCSDAWSQLADGMIVSIDNDHVITR